MGLFDTITILYGKAVAAIKPFSAASNGSGCLRTEENAEATKQKLVKMLEDSIPESLHSATRIKHRGGDTAAAATAKEFPSSVCVRSATLSQRAIEEVTKTAGSLTDFVVCCSSSTGDDEKDEEENEEEEEVRIPVKKWYTWYPSIAMTLCNCSPAAMRSGVCPDATRQFATFESALRDATEFMRTKAQRVCRYAKGHVSNRRKLICAARTTVYRSALKAAMVQQTRDTREVKSENMVDRRGGVRLNTSFWHNGAVYKIIGLLINDAAYCSTNTALAEKVTQFYISLIEEALLVLQSADPAQQFFLAHVDVTDPLSATNQFSGSSRSIINNDSKVCAYRAVYAVLESDFK